MSIRRAGSADLPVLRALADAAHVCRPDSDDSVWLAAADGTLLGFIACRSVLDEMELLALAVAHAALAALAPTTAYLEVRVDNHGAQALYQHLGYRVSGRRKAYYPNPDGSRTDALLMTLHPTP